MSILRVSRELIQNPVFRRDAGIEYVRWRLFIPITSLLPLILIGTFALPKIGTVSERLGVTTGAAVAVAAIVFLVSLASASRVFARDMSPHLVVSLMLTPMTPVQFALAKIFGRGMPVLVTASCLWVLAIIHGVRTGWMGAEVSGPGGQYRFAFQVHLVVWLLIGGMLLVWSYIESVRASIQRRGVVWSVIARHFGMLLTFALPAAAWFGVTALKAQEVFHWVPFAATVGVMAAMMCYLAASTIGLVEDVRNRLLGFIEGAGDF